MEAVTTRLDRVDASIMHSATIAHADCVMLHLTYPCMAGYVHNNNNYYYLVYLLLYLTYPCMAGHIHNYL